jgi:hypothetical protein
VRLDSGHPGHGGVRWKTSIAELKERQEMDGILKLGAS